MANHPIIGFFYDLLRLPDGRSMRLKVRSMAVNGREMNHILVQFAGV